MEERLREIKELSVRHYTSSSETIEVGIAGEIIRNHLGWLIQQAEEKQRLEERVKELENLNDLAKDTNAHVKQKNQRYKQALEEIIKEERSMGRKGSETEVIARQALEDSQ